MMTLLRTVVVTGLLAAGLTSAAHADFLTAREKREGQVTVCSRTGFECYTARLVNSHKGWKMRLRNGTQIDCAGDCRDTLRRTTVDFWQDQRDRAK